MLIEAYYAEKDSVIPVVCHNIVVRFRMRQYRQRHPLGGNRETEKQRNSRSSLQKIWQNFWKQIYASEMPSGCSTRQRAFLLQLTGLIMMG